MPKPPQEDDAAALGSGPRAFFRMALGRALEPRAAFTGSVASWRLGILKLLLSAGAVFGLFAFVPSLILSLHEHLWGVAMVDTLAYAWVVTASLSPRWSYATRVRGLVLLLYLISLALLVKPNTAASGLLWITILPVLAAIFLDLGAALACWALAALTILGCGWGMGLGLLETPRLVSEAHPLAAWLVTACSALFLSAFVALPAAILLRGLAHTHRALSREEERFSRIFQLSPEPIAIRSKEGGRFLDVNGAWSRTFGWTREETVGRTTEELGIWPADAERVSLEAEVIRSGAFGPVALELVRKDGKAASVLMSARMLDLAGEACLLIISQDLTASRQAEMERRRLELELQHAQKLESLGSLAGGVAHDMNNILAAILGLASMLQEQYPADAGLAKGLTGIQNAGDRGRKLVRALTDFARKGLEDAQPVDLNELVRQEADLLRSTTRSKVELVLELDPDLPRILGEPSALTNALMNLCVNALDAMPEGGVLSFRTRLTPGGAVTLSVADTGQGMTPEVRDRAVEPFFTTKPAGKGTGLGLPGVYGTMKAHGGSVDLWSQLGEGARVTLTFPRYAPEEPTPVHAPEPAAVATPGGLRVLVVDDDPIIQETLPGLLAFLGHTCHSASRGQEALDLLEGGLEVDLVILDHNMPGLTGAETLVRLRALRPELPVILSTGYLEPSVEDVARRFPKVWLLNKPYTLPGVRSRLASIR